ncbi:MAG: mercury methylation corrinoid protein HgcA [bacterium]|nr:mercury methylation corrinoid protein HgcA [bacterium]
MTGEKGLPPPTCCAGRQRCCPASGRRQVPHWQTGQLATPAGMVPRVATRLQTRDKLGAWRVRWGLGRMDYRVPPGLYAVGDPDGNAPVLVSANYKLSFDRLRRELAGLSLWLLVLDTGGINVWCAAGKGTFGTGELVRRLEAVQLDRVISHRTIILPQLAAPGVAAHEVKRRSGFRVLYGPVRAGDIPAFLKDGAKAAPAMRLVRFGLLDRLALVPVELVAMARPAGVLFLALLVLNLAGGGPPVALLGRALSGFIPFLGAMLAGTVLVPALLPYLPGRAFAGKGWLSGLLWTAVYAFLIAPGSGWMATASYFLILPAIAAFLALNFTGSSTYTSLSGVVREMGIALPAIVVSAGLGAVGLIVSRLL